MVWRECAATLTDRGRGWVPVLVLEAQAQVLELSHEVLELLAEGCGDGSACSLT